MTPTTRPWKERREEIEQLAKPDLKFPYKEGAEPIETWRPTAAAIRDCLREIDRRGELIGNLASRLRGMGRGVIAPKAYDTVLLNEADEVRRG